MTTITPTTITPTACPVFGQLVEDQARDAAVGYLAAAVPGGAVVLAIAQEAGIGWTFSSGRHDVDPTPEFNQLRGLVFMRAANLIEYAYAHPKTGQAVGG